MIPSACPCDLYFSAKFAEARADAQNNELFLFFTANNILSEHFSIILLRD